MNDGISEVEDTTPKLNNFDELNISDTNHDIIYHVKLSKVCIHELEDYLEGFNHDIQMYLFGDNKSIIMMNKSIFELKRILDMTPKLEEYDKLIEDIVFWCRYGLFGETNCKLTMSEIYHRDPNELRNERRGYWYDTSVYDLFGLIKNWIPPNDM